MYKLRSEIHFGHFSKRNEIRNKMGICFHFEKGFRNEMAILIT